MILSGVMLAQDVLEASAKAYLNAINRQIINEKNREIKATI